MVHSLIDPEKRKAIREKLAGDKPLLPKKAKPAPDSPLIHSSRCDWFRLDLSKVETMIVQASGVPIWVAVEEAKKQGKIIIPNSVHDRMLVGTGHWEKPDIEPGYPAWTGTAIIYEAPDVDFGDRVIYNWKEYNDVKEYSISFSIPELYIGQRNAALIIEHPLDFEIISLGSNNYELKVPDCRSLYLFHLIKESGQQLLDDQQIDYVERHLVRSPGNYIGLLGRGDTVRRQGVNADYLPSNALGVHVISIADYNKLVSLSEAKAQLNIELNAAIKTYNISKAKDALNSGAEANSVIDKKTQLHWASYYGIVELMQLLIHLRADINKRDRSGNSPLSYAKMSTNPEAVKLLERLGAIE